MLLNLLTWQENDELWHEKQYMSDLKKFRYRPVLPDPLNLGGAVGVPNGSRRNRSSHSASGYRNQQKSKPQQSTKTRQPHQPKKDELPEVRQEVSDFAKLVEQRLKQQGEKKKKK